MRFKFLMFQFFIAFVIYKNFQFTLTLSIYEYNGFLYIDLVFYNLVMLIC